MFSIEPEKYWAFPSTYSPERCQEEAQQFADSGQYLASEKLDGNWCRFVMQNGKAKMQTRGISKKTGTYGEVQDKVPHIFQFLCSLVTGDSIIIGELFFPGGNDKDVGSILRCLPKKAVERQVTTPLHFRIFDIWMLNGESYMKTPFEERCDVMDNFDLDCCLAAGNSPSMVRCAKQYATDNMFSLLEAVFEHGGEGIVLQRKSGIPEPGKRPARKSLKIKREIKKPVDVFCTGFASPIREYTGKAPEDWMFWENVKTNALVNENKYLEYVHGGMWEPVTRSYYYGYIGSIHCGVYRGEEIVAVCKVSGLTDTLKQQIKDNPKEFLMKPMRISGMEFTADGSVRHPEFIDFRDDIDAKDCTYEKIFG